MANALGLLPASWLLESRDTLGDVGTSISTEQECQTAVAGAGRPGEHEKLQEALRSLEEYGKVVAVEFAKQIEKIRYQSYTSTGHRAGPNARQRLADARLCVLVSDALCRASLVGTVKEATLGGPR